VVAGRLALPWPLREVADWQVAGGPVHSLAGLELTGANYIVAMGAIFLAIILLLGLFDLLERLYYARFIIGLVRDLRNKVFQTAIGVAGEERKRLTRGLDDATIYDDDSGEDAVAEAPERQSGDLVSRLVSDTARLKGGAQSFLVHVVTNSLLFIGIIIVLCLVDLPIGLVFAAAAAAAAMTTGWAASRMFCASTTQRAKEGLLADKIEAAVKSNPVDASFVRINASSGDHEASQTRLEGIATWSAHVFFGLAVLGALWVGAHGVEAGRIAVADLVVTMMYALLMRGSFMRLARQGAKSGKVMGAALRLVQVLENPDSTRDRPGPRDRPRAGPVLKVVGKVIL
jgi:ABC-type multidrug transport system fused ATPase/permease subunit